MIEIVTTCESVYGCPSGKYRRLSSKAEENEAKCFTFGENWPGTVRCKDSSGKGCIGGDYRPHSVVLEAGGSACQLWGSSGCIGKSFTLNKVGLPVALQISQDKPDSTLRSFKCVSFILILVYLRRTYFEYSELTCNRCLFNKLSAFKSNDKDVLSMLRKYEKEVNND